MLDFLFPVSDLIIFVVTSIWMKTINQILPKKLLTKSNLSLTRIGACNNWLEAHFNEIKLKLM